MSKSKSESDKGSAESLSFEQALKRLEELVRRLEQGNIPLEQSLSEYAEAVGLMRQCQAKLDAAQMTIEQLSGFDGNGQPITRPMDVDTNMTLEEKRTARSSRRSAGGQSSAATPSRRKVDEDSQLF